MQRIQTKFDIDELIEQLTDTLDLWLYQVITQNVNWNTRMRFTT